MSTRFFYHSFPRRGAGAPQEIEKGIAVLRSIKDIGLVLLPEQYEWNQPTIDGNGRIFPVLQKRVCFTELGPTELPDHAMRFGNFALEFEIGTLRDLGAIPVFYIPQARGQHGSALGLTLIGVTSDAISVIGRLAELNRIFNGAIPVASKITCEFGFARSPEGRGKYQIDTTEAKNFLNAIGHAVTPWDDLKVGVSALMNFFCPADNTKHDKLLEYYREREWRIACGFALNGVPVLRSLDASEKNRLLTIDNAFFSRVLETDTGRLNTLDLALLHPGIGGRRIIEMVRRVIVPGAAVAKVADILSDLAKPPPVIAIETLPAGTGAKEAEPASRRKRDPKNSRRQLR